MFCYLILQILVQTGKKVAAKMRITCERPFHNSDKLSISELKLAKSIVFKLIKKRPFSRFCSRYPSVFWGSLKSFLGVTKCPQSVFGSGCHAILAEESHHQGRLKTSHAAKSLNTSLFELRECLVSTLSEITDRRIVQVWPTQWWDLHPKRA